MKDKPLPSAEQAWDPQRLLHQVLNAPSWVPKRPAEWRLPRGKHEGCSLAWALVAKPDYVAWILRLPAPSGWMGEAGEHSLRMLASVDVSGWTPNQRFAEAEAGWKRAALVVEASVFTGS